jgi:hypothetical protein
LIAINDLWNRSAFDIRRHWGVRITETPLEIVFHGVDHSDALEQRIRKEAARLNRIMLKS